MRPKIRGTPLSGWGAEAPVGRSIHRGLACAVHRTGGPNEEQLRLQDVQNANRARSQDLRRTADASEYGGHPHSDLSPCNGDPPRHSRVRVQAEGLIAPVRAGVPYSGVVVNDQ